MHMVRHSVDSVNGATDLNKLKPNGIKYLLFNIFCDKILSILCGPNEMNPNLASAVGHSVWSLGKPLKRLEKVYNLLPHD